MVGGGGGPGASPGFCAIGSFAALHSKEGSTMAKRTRAGARTKAPAKTKKRPTDRRKYWSAAVMRRSNALDIEEGAFAQTSARKIAESLKRSAEQSRRRRAGPYQSAMSMLNFYINRAGKSLAKREKQPLEKAKIELRKLFHKDQD